MENRIYDDFYANFNDEEAFVAELIDQEKASKWVHDVPSNSIIVEEVENFPIDAEHMAEEFGVSADAMTDTMANTALSIQFDGKKYLVRDCAMKSLLETAKVTGGIICRMTPKHLESLFNLCLPLVSGNSLILVRDEKVSAVLSDEKNGYTYLPMSSLVTVTSNILQDKFEDVHFVNGSLCHDYMSAVWEINEPNLLKDYYSALGGESTADTNFVPAVRVSSSDVGTSSATIIPMFRTSKGINIRICPEIKVPHKKGHDMTEFSEKAEASFAKFADATTKLADMSKITLENPVNVFILACKKAGLPKKLSCKALEDFQMYNGDDASTAHDTYLGICEILSYAKAAGYDEKDMCRLEELISKCLFFKWEDLDMPGEHKW